MIVRQYLVLMLAALLSGGATAAEETVTSADGSQMVLVPAGPFIMGTGETAPDARPPHRRELPDFYIDQAEVTIGQYARFIKETGAAPPPGWKNASQAEDRRELPITNITWFDAMRYAIWAGKRLPTEAEWEKAARGTDGRRYPWGNVDEETRRNLQDSKQLEPGNSRPQGASPCGAMHMSGNAWEWTADWYDAYPGSSLRSVHFGHQYKVVRGGGAEYLYGIPNTGTTTARARLLPYGAHDFVGFRCVKDADPTRAPYDPAERLAESEAVLQSFDRAPVELSYEAELDGYLDAQRLPVRIVGSEDRSGYVRMGVPFPKGALKDVSRIRVNSWDGRPRPLQTHTLAPWEDGSVRWVLLDFPGRADEQLELTFNETDAALANGPRLQVDESASEITIGTGPLTLHVSPESLLHNVTCHGNPFLDDMRIVVDAEGDNGRRTLHAIPAERMTLETAGPLRAVIRLQGQLGDDSGKPSEMAYDLRLHALADSARLNLMVTLTHAVGRASHDAADLRPSILVHDAAVEFGRPSTSAEAAIAIDRGAAHVAGNKRVEIRQDDALHFSILTDGEVRERGQHAPGWLALRGLQRWTVFAVRYFRQNHPEALYVTPDGVGVRLWSGNQPFEWEATLAKTHEIVIDAIDSPEHGYTPEPLRATLPPAWMCGTKAIGGPMLPRCRESIERFCYWELMREATMQQYVKGMPTGLRDFGDAYMGGPYKGKNAFLNLEYDVHYNFLLQYLRTGDIWYLTAAEPMARHQADIDTDHVTAQPYKHSPLHTTTRADIAHMFIRGLLLHYVLTGEERSLDVAREIGEHIRARTLHRDGYGNERQIGWGLYALTGLYDITRDERYLEAARSLCDHLAAGQSLTGKFDIRWDNRIAFMNGLAMGGLLTVEEHTNDERIAQMILRVAKRTWGMYQDYALRTLNAYCWGLEQTHDPRFLDALERTWIASMDFLSTAVSVETFAWRFPHFAARYDLFPLFDRVPDNLPDPESWRGIQFSEPSAELYFRPTGNEPAPVLVLRKGLAAGTVEVFDASGSLIERHVLDDTSRLYQPVALNLKGEHSTYRLRLTSRDARNWQIHYDNRAHLTVFAPEGRALHELNPRAYGFVRQGTERIRIRLEAMHEGYHMATLYDADGNAVTTGQRFVDYEDPGRYVIELSAPVTGNAERPWSLEIYDAKIIELEGMSPYWSPDPEELFDPERL